MSGAGVNAVLFDVDGTLTDSNDLHVAAWLETFAHFGVEASEADVQAQIGKGGDQLVPVFVRPEALQALQPEIEAFRGELYTRDYLPKVRAFPGVRALFERLRADGCRLVLASSGKSHEVKHAKEVADIADLVYAETTADDVEYSKPRPDIFRAALAKLDGVASESAIAVGDTPYDAQSAGGAGVRTIGLLSGGFAEGVLREAGCVAVYADVQALLDGYDASPLSPR